LLLFAHGFVAHGFFAHGFVAHGFYGREIFENRLKIKKTFCTKIDLKSRL